MAGVDLGVVRHPTPGEVGSMLAGGNLGDIDRDPARVTFALHLERNTGRPARLGCKLLVRSDAWTIGMRLASTITSPGSSSPLEAPLGSTRSTSAPPPSASPTAIPSPLFDHLALPVFLLRGSLGLLLAELVERHVELERPTLAKHLEVYARSWRVPRDEAREIGAVDHRGVVHAENDVARSHAGLLGGTAGLDFPDEGALGTIEAHRLRRAFASTD